jgi:hypothetical protein
MKASASRVLGDLPFAFVFTFLPGLAIYLYCPRSSQTGPGTHWGWAKVIEGVADSPEQIFFFLIWLLFPTIGIVFTFRVLLGVIDLFRYGGSTFVMNSVPAPIGGQLNGSIGAQGLRLREDEDIELRLECRAREVRRSAASRRVQFSERVEWSTDRELGRGVVATFDGAAMLPVRLPIPPSARQTGERVELGGGESDTFSWWLVARVEPHHGWNAEFEIPVFRTAERPLAEELQRREREAVSVEGPPLRPPSSRIVVHAADDGGILIVYPTPRSLPAFALWWLLSLPLYLIVIIDFMKGRWLGTIGWLVLALLVNGLAASSLFRAWPRRLYIDRESIRLACGFPIIGQRLRMPVSEAGEVGRDLNFLAIKRKGQTGIFKREFYVAPRLSSEAETRWLTAEIEQALARYR